MSMAAKPAFSPYEGGVGGKSRKPLHKRSQTTPYDRPIPPALRNPNSNNNNNGWLSKIVNPASKLITTSAHKLFASVFRKRLLPPPSPPQPQHQQPSPLSEENMESADKLQEAGPVGPCPAGLEQSVKEVGRLSSNSNNDGVSELEQILKQKTFTRSEIDHLTALLHSRTVDAPVLDNEKPSVKNLSTAVPTPGKFEELAYTPQQNGIGSHKLLADPSTPIGRSQAFEDDVASPTELAKAYMGSRPSKVSPSMLGFRTQAYREDSPMINNIPFNSTSSALSLVPKFSARASVLENGFVSPRSRGRSAIYSMARTPYSRMHPSASQKGSGFRSDSLGDPSSSSQCGMDKTVLSGNKQMTLKRRSSMLDDDIGSIGPIRRIRQKPNLLSSKSLSVPVSVSGSVISKSHGENTDNEVPATSFAPVPSQSTVMAKRILQQLDKFSPSPKEKLSEHKIAIARDKSASTLTTEMLSGQALRSLEKVDSLKFLEHVRDDNKSANSFDTKLPDHQETLLKKHDSVEENGQSRFLNSIAPKGIDVTTSKKDTMIAFKKVDSGIMNTVSHPPAQKKRGFQMSAHEDYLDLDDDGYPNGTIPASVLDEGKYSETFLVEGKTLPSKDAILEKPPVSAGETPPASITLNNINGDKFSATSVITEKSSSIIFSVAPAPSTTIQPTVLAKPPSFVSDNVSPPKESNLASPLFSFASKSDDKVSDKAPLFTFSSSTSVLGNTLSSKPTTPSDLKLKSLSSDNVAGGATGSRCEIPESYKFDGKDAQKVEDLFKKPETAPSSAALTSATNLFSFGAPSNNGFSNGPVAPTFPSYSSPAPVLNFNDVKDQNKSVASTSTSSATMTTAITSGSNDGFSPLAPVPSFSTIPLPQFGSSSASTAASPVSSTLASPVSTSGISHTDPETKNKQEITFGKVTTNPFGGTSSATINTGSSFFGFNASTTSTANLSSQGPTTPFGSGIGSVGGAQVSSPFSTGLASVSQSTAVQFGSSASTPTFGSASTFSSSLFSSSAPSAKLFGSGPTFGMSVASSEAKTVSSSSGTTNNLFGSSSQGGQSPIFGSTINLSAPSTGFQFGSSSSPLATPSNTPVVFGSSITDSTTSVFSFTSAAANAPPPTPVSSSQPVFGSSNSVFAFGSASASAGNNSDQMSMEDSMAEDTIQATTPSAPVFGQPQSFSTPPGANPFQFGGQQNAATPVNTSPFQASGSIDFNPGGSFSLGSTGGDKSSRRMVKVKKNRKK